MYPSVFVSPCLPLGAQALESALAPSSNMVDYAQGRPITGACLSPRCSIGYRVKSRSCGDDRKVLNATFMSDHSPGLNVCVATSTNWGRLALMYPSIYSGMDMQAPKDPAWLIDRFTLRHAYLPVPPVILTVKCSLTLSDMSERSQLTLFGSLQV